jgi:hypothetical protein
MTGPTMSAGPTASRLAAWNTWSRQAASAGPTTVWPSRRRLAARRAGRDPQSAGTQRLRQDHPRRVPAGPRRRDPGELRVAAAPGRVGAALRGRIGGGSKAPYCPTACACRRRSGCSAPTIGLPPTPCAAALWTWTASDGGRTRSSRPGERQRLFIALTMLSNPELVVLDELTNAFDARGRRETCALTRRLRADGLSVCLSHTISTRPSAGATRPPVLRPGRLLAIGHPEEIAEGGRLEDANRGADRRGGGDMTPGRSRALWRTTLVELRLYLREPPRRSSHCSCR